MKPQFLGTAPALVMENSLRVLVIADLHFGAEAELASYGVYVPSNSATRRDRILACIEESDPDLLILLGDVKHGIPFTSRQEYAELPAILSSLRERVPIRVTPGNHDGGLQRFLKPGELLPSAGAVIDGIGYLHGHTRPDPDLLGKLMIIGHHHPVVHVYDEVGCSLRAHPAFLLAEIEPGCIDRESSPDTDGSRVLFMPAFFELAGGMDVREVKASRLSPLSRCIREEGAEVFLHDGTYIDTLTALEKP
jgi:metallophosphoesterase superfamily enzyme